MRQTILKSNRPYKRHPRVCLFFFQRWFREFWFFFDIYFEKVSFFSNIVELVLKGNGNSIEFLQESLNLLQQKLKPLFRSSKSPWFVSVISFLIATFSHSLLTNLIISSLQHRHRQRYFRRPTASCSHSHSHRLRQTSPPSPSTAVPS